MFARVFIFEFNGFANASLHLEKHKFKIIDHISFPDHYKYNKSDISKIIKKATKFSFADALADARPRVEIVTEEAPEFGEVKKSKAKSKA